MFSKLNNRIARTLVAAVIPAAMTFGMTASTFGRDNCNTPNQVMQVRWTSSLTFTGNCNGASVSFQMFYQSPKAINGVINVNGNQYPFVAYVEGNNIHGVLNDDGREVRFEALGQADLLYLQINGRTVTLRLVS